jgi:hypothetical protein
MAQISDKDDSEIDAEEMARKFRLSYPRRVNAKWVFGKAFCFPVTVSPTDSRRVEIANFTFLC